MTRIFILLLALSVSVEGVASGEAVAKLQDYAFANDNSSGRKGRRTDSVLVIKDGKTIFEKYARGYDEDMKHIMWSVSKTVMSLLYGVALHEKLIDLEDSICKYDQFPNAKFCDIKIRHVLEWSTGIRWIEEYEESGRPREASILAMAYGEGRRDMYRFVKEQPIAYPPGKSWTYSSGDSILASGLLHKIFKSSDLSKVFREKIADPVGMKNWTWESDAAGTLAGAYYFYSTSRDMARLGELILNDGMWNKRRIIAAEYVRFMKKMPEAYRIHRIDHDKDFVSGGHIWINDPHDTGLQSPWPGAPKDTIMAVGHWGQLLMIVPSMNIVAVRTGDCRDGSFSRAEFAALVTAAGRGR